MLKFIHAADFHLDSVFSALTDEQAAERRRESRELGLRLANYANTHGIDLVLLAGDLFDSRDIFQETGEQLSAALGVMKAQVLIAPGNHDWYDAKSPWATIKWPDNVHIFQTNHLTKIELPKWNLVVHGAAFTAPEQSESMLKGFSAPKDGKRHFALMHGDFDSANDRYNPIQQKEIEDSNLEFLALGHIHKQSDPKYLGKTLCAWPGCPEGRGFDELGEKGFYVGAMDEQGQVALKFIPFAKRHHEVLDVDVTGKDPRIAVEETLPPNTETDLYRIRLIGETDHTINTEALTNALAHRFYTLEIRDFTHATQDIWARAEENSLRGLFLRELRNKFNAAESDEERELVTKAVTFGLAALDHRDIGERL